jgi:hypothetical protein
MMARGAVRKAVRCGAVVSVSAVAGGWRLELLKIRGHQVKKNCQNSKSERQQKEDRGQDCVSHNYNN